jgi:hypothetical protein
MNIKTLAMIFAFSCISNIHGAVTEKLAVNNSKIETLKKEIKTGSFNAQKSCSRNCKNCSRNV